MALVASGGGTGRELEVYKAADVPGTNGSPAKRSAKVLPFRDFEIRPEELSNLLERAVGEKGSVDLLEQEYNGVMGLAAKLRVDPGSGLGSELELLSRQLHFGANASQDSAAAAAEHAVKGRCKMQMQACSDTGMWVLIMLAAAGVGLAVGVGADPFADMVPGVAALVMALLSVRPSHPRPSHRVLLAALPPAATPALVLTGSSPSGSAAQVVATWAADSHRVGRYRQLSTIKTDVMIGARRQVIGAPACRLLAVEALPAVEVLPAVEALPLTAPPVCCRGLCNRSLSRRSWWATSSRWLMAT